MMRELRCLSVWSSLVRQETVPQVSPGITETLWHNSQELERHTQKRNKEQRSSLWWNSDAWFRIKRERIYPSTTHRMTWFSWMLSLLLEKRTVIPNPRLPLRFRVGTPWFSCCCSLSKSVCLEARVTISDLDHGERNLHLPFFLLLITLFFTYEDSLPSSSCSRNQACNCIPCYLNGYSEKSFLFSHVSHYDFWIQGHNGSGNYCFGRKDTVRRHCIQVDKRDDTITSATKSSHPWKKERQTLPWLW
jgi:hypothetical protein